MMGREMVGEGGRGEMVMTAFADGTVVEDR
jgi:hypothetical protein